MLLQELSQNDRLVMEKYIECYGVRGIKSNLDEWLKYWNFSKRKLYKLLGNKLIYKVPFEYKKDSKIIEYEIRDCLLSMPFRRLYHIFYMNFIAAAYDKKEISEDIKFAFSSITDWENFINDGITKAIKMKQKGNKKMLQIQKGMKPIRALQKIIDYFPDAFEDAVRYYNKEYSYNQISSYTQAFEDFRIAHSMILNDKTIKGNLCISIHPMDFMTMSDNDSGWSSCMSWTDEGCYRIGSVEMMNSNNVLCCYLENEKPYIFKKDTESFKWNNKRWRSLVYYTNDIIMSGKAYPYPNDSISKELISIIRNLAKENLNRNFSFGPELYKDMIHINSLNEMRRNYDWIDFGNYKKHNIIWETKGMYNDMLNDNNTKYWCYRNKVKHNKIYQVSGKAPCLCCGDDVIIYDEDETWDYNDRYSNVAALVCYDCEKNNSCDNCGKVVINQDLKRVAPNSKLCKSCFDKWIKRCPICNKPINLMNKAQQGYIKNKKVILKHPNIIMTLYEYLENIDFDKYLEPIYTCDNCRETLLKNYEFFNHDLNRKWSPSGGYQIFPATEELEKFKYPNLKSVPFNTKEEILS